MIMKMHPSRDNSLGRQYSRAAGVNFGDGGSAPGNNNSNRDAHLRSPAASSASSGRVVASGHTGFTQLPGMQQQLLLQQAQQQHQQQQMGLEQLQMLRLHQQQFLADEQHKQQQRQVELGSSNNSNSTAVPAYLQSALNLSSSCSSSNDPQSAAAMTGLTQQQQQRAAALAAAISAERTRSSNLEALFGSTSTASQAAAASSSSAQPSCSNSQSVLATQSLLNSSNTTSLAALANAGATAGAQQPASARNCNNGSVGTTTGACVEDIALRRRVLDVLRMQELARQQQQQGQGQMSLSAAGHSWLTNAPNASHVQTSSGTGLIALSSQVQPPNSSGLPRTSSDATNDAVTALHKQHLLEPSLRMRLLQQHQSPTAAGLANIGGMKREHANIGVAAQGGTAAARSATEMMQESPLKKLKRTHPELETLSSSFPLPSKSDTRSRLALPFSINLTSYSHAWGQLRTKGPMRKEVFARKIFEGRIPIQGSLLGGGVAFNTNTRSIIQLANQQQQGQRTSQCYRQHSDEASLSMGRIQAPSFNAAYSTMRGVGLSHANDESAAQLLRFYSSFDGNTITR